jgi:hypothetical protein
MGRNRHARVNHLPPPSRLCHCHTQTMKHALLQRRSLLVPALLLPCVTSCLATAPASQAPQKPWRERLIDPVTAPTTFESPVIDSQIRPMWMRRRSRATPRPARAA